MTGSVAGAARCACLVLWLGACGPPVPPGATAPSAAAPETATVTGSHGVGTEPVAQPVAPPLRAYQSGWMPLVSTNVPAFLAAYPEGDGRGVLIAILDGGIDPVPGLARLPDGSDKILDVRDFSGEGRVALVPAELRDDLIQVGAAVLRGAGRVRALHAGGPVYGGQLREYALGELPAADLNGNGRLGDSLAVVVLRLADGWAVLADTDGDGTLAGERPVRDYAAGRERFGWTTGGRPRPVSVAVNLAERGEGVPPELDLVFDTSGHGTHVAGIAAGSGLYGIAGFNGVAPGASLLDLKIANDARGGITVTGSMVRAIAYAIHYAARRGMPLVVNLSYGVGNEIEGRARIDALVDSLLTDHPEVVMTISAGNDGPGISTLGFPATATRPIAVGATYPGAFLPLHPNGRRYDDQIAFFSARGGEMARPDLVAPGMAYSTVPPWDVGEEIKNGTSMAAPHVAGLAALLLSALAAEGRGSDGLGIRRALMASARPLPGGTVIDQGAGLPDLFRAWSLLRGDDGVGPRDVMVTVGGHSRTALILDGMPDGDRDTAVTFSVRQRAPAAGSASYRLRSDVPWLRPPGVVAVGESPTEVAVRIGPGVPAVPGAQVGTVEGWGTDSTYGPAFRLVTTVVASQPLPPEPLTFRPSVAAGALHRIFLRADSGRGFEVEVGEPRGAPLLAFLHEPGGMPWRGGAAQVVTSPDSAAVFRVDGRDVAGGVFELVTVAGPLAPISPTVRVTGAPVMLSARRNADTVTVTVRNAGASPASVWPGLDLVGGERRIRIGGRGPGDRRVPFTLPEWAGRVVVELQLERDQWPLFTDFGLTLLDQDGRQLGTEPQNYAVGLLAVDLPPGRSTRQAEIVLSPGFAEPEANVLWEARLAVRLLADAPVAVVPPDSSALYLEQGVSAERTFLLPPLPWPLGDGFFPLSHVTARAGGRLWSRESGLPNQLPPIMP